MYDIRLAISVAMAGASSTLAGRSINVFMAANYARAKRPPSKLASLKSHHQLPDLKVRKQAHGNIAKLSIGAPNHNEPIMNAPDQHSSFFLIDSALLGGLTNPLITSKYSRPDWVIPIYKEIAVVVSPLVLDIEAAAQQDGQLEHMMALVNAAQPQLHVSIIDTALSHAELAQHLRRFIFIVTETGEQQTLRFADCICLPALAAIFTPAQWATIVAPFIRWRIHQRDGTLTSLPPAESGHAPLAIPFTLTRQQSEELEESAAVDGVIAMVRNTRHGQPMPGSMDEQYRWASEALAMWRTSGNAENTVLIAVADAVIYTQGKVLHDRKLPALLAEKNSAAVLSYLGEMVQKNSGGLQV